MGKEKKPLERFKSTTLALWSVFLLQSSEQTIKVQKHSIPTHSMPNHSMSNHSMPNHSMPNHSMYNHSMPNHSMPNHSMSNHSMPNHSMPNHSMPIFLIFFLIASVLRTLVSICPDRHVNVCLFGSTSVRAPCGVIVNRLAGTL